MTLTNNNGFSLTGAMVSVAIVGIASAAMASVVNNISTAQRSMSQRFDILSIQGGLHQLVTTADYCTSQLSDGPGRPRRFNTTGVTPTVPAAAPVELQVIRVNPDPNSPPLVQEGQFIPGGTMRVGRIQLANILQFNANRYIAELRVNFVNQPGETPRKPLVFPGVQFDVDNSNPADARITNCMIGSSGSGGGAQMMILTQEYPSGANGGDVPANAWYVRHLNTVRTNTIDNAALNASARNAPNTPAGNPSNGTSQITLPAGTYSLRAQVHADSAGDHVAKWFNVTDNVDVLIGTLAWAEGGQATDSTIVGSFTIDVPTVFELRHRTSTKCDVVSYPSCCQDYHGGYCSTQGGNANFGVPEVYATLEIQRH